MIITSILCFIFTAICTMPWFNSSTLIFVLFTALCAIESVFLVRVKSRLLRFVQALVPPLVTFLTSGTILWRQCCSEWSASSMWSI